MDTRPAWPPRRVETAPVLRPWTYRRFDLMSRVPDSARASFGRPAIWMVVWPCLILAFGMMGGLIAGLAFGLWAGFTGTDMLETNRMVIMFQLSIAAANMALLVVFWRWAVRRGLGGAVLDLRPDLFWRETAFAVIVFVAAAFTGGQLVTLVMRLVEQPLLPEDVLPPDAGPLLFLLAVPGLVIIGPAIEEMIFRGWMLPALKQRGLGWTGALILSSLIFGLLHVFAGPASVAYTFVLGFYAGLARILTGRLWAPILIHMINNLVAIGLPLLTTQATG